MDELESRLSGEFQARAQDPVPDAAQTIDVVRRGARRQRTVRGLVTGSVAALAVIGLGVGAMAVQGGRDVEPALPVVSPTATPSAEPNPASSASPSPGAADSANVIVREGGYPDSTPATDEVWAQVGDGWSLEMYSMRVNVYDEERPPADTAVLYLMDPEGNAFQVNELDQAHSGGARVVSWQEDAGTARIVWEGELTEQYPGGAALLDLRTGVWDPIEFSLDSQPSTAVTFITANADGDELWLGARWLDGSPNSQGYFLWSPQDGWSKSALTSIVGSFADGSSEWSIAWPPLYGYVPSPDGNAIPLQVDDTTITVDDGAEIEDTVPAQVGVYRLDSDSMTENAPNLPEWVKSCSGPDWLYVGKDEGQSPWGEDGTIGYDCYGEWDEATDSSKNDSVRVSNGYVSPWSLAPQSFVQLFGSADDQELGPSSIVGFGEATPSGTGDFECNC